MKDVATIKLKIQPNQTLLDMSVVFLKAVQYAVDKGWEAQISNRFKLHHLVYKELRQRLPADFTIEAIAKASENLKTTDLKIKPNIRKAPLSFNRKLFGFSTDKVRLATFVPKQRANIPVKVPKYYRKYLDWRYQTLELIIDRKNRMFFHITFSKEVKAENFRGNGNLGVDLGVNNIAVTSDGRKFNGHKTKIMQYQWLRRRLQRKGTKSAKRHLKMLSGRQKRYMRDINHCISKEIANNGLIGLENLKGIRKRIYGSKRMNRWLHSWSFYQLQTFIEYKTLRLGGVVLYHNPYMTSQICSNCQYIGSRHFDSFYCSHCGFSCQSDFNASCNLRRLNVNQPIVVCDESKAESELRMSIATNSASV